MTEEDSPGGLFRRARLALGMLGARTLVVISPIKTFYATLKTHQRTGFMQPRCLGLSFDDHCLSHSVIVKLHVPVLTQACGLLRESVGGVGFEVVSCGLCICRVFVPAPPVDFSGTVNGVKDDAAVAIGLPRRTPHVWGARVPRRFSVSSFLKSSGGGSHPRCLRRLASAKVRRRCRQA